MASFARFILQLMHVGAPADLVLFDLDRPAIVDVDAFLSKNKNSPFDGRPVQGVVVATLVDGRFVYDGRD